MRWCDERKVVQAAATYEIWRIDVDVGGAEATLSSKGLRLSMMNCRERRECRNVDVGSIRLISSSMQCDGVVALSTKRDEGCLVSGKRI